MRWSGCGSLWRNSASLRPWCRLCFRCSWPVSALVPGRAESSSAASIVRPPSCRSALRPCGTADRTLRHPRSAHYRGRRTRFDQAREKNLVWNSSTYYLVSGSWILLALLPWCTCMGATFPFAMAAIRRLSAGNPSTPSAICIWRMCSERCSARLFPLSFGLSSSAFGGRFTSPSC